MKKFQKGTGTAVTTTGRRARLVASVRPVVESLERRCLLSAATATPDLFPSALDADLAYGTGDKLHLAYQDGGTKNLMYAARDSRGRWSDPQPIDESADDVGAFVSLATDPKGNPAAAYYDATSGDLKYAQWDAKRHRWMAQAVDMRGNVGLFASLAFDAQGNPLIAHYDTTNDDLKLTSHDGHGWRTVTLDAEGDVGQHPSIAVNPFTDRWAIAYARQDAGGEVKLLQQGERTPRVLEGGGRVGGLDLALDAKALPSVAYVGAPAGDLHLLRYNGNFWESGVVLPGEVLGRNVSAWIDAAGGRANFLVSGHDGAQLVRATDSGYEAVALAGGEAVALAVAADGVPSFAVEGEEGLSVGERLPDDQAPTRLRARPVSGSEIRLHWLDNSGRESGYAIEASSDGGKTFRSVGVAGAGATAFNVKGLSTGAKYSFRVSALGGGAVRGAASAPADGETADHNNPGWYRVRVTSPIIRKTVEPDASAIVATGEMRWDSPDGTQRVAPDGSNFSDWVFADSWQSAVYQAVDGEAQAEDRTYQFPETGNFLVKEADGASIPDEPGQKLITFEDLYTLPDSDEDYNDHWWRVEVEQASVVRIAADGEYGAEAGPTPVTFTVSLDRSPDQADGDIEVVVNAPGGTATDGDDYSLTGDFTRDNGKLRLTFAPGETKKVITLTPVEDGVKEAEETAVLTLADASDAYVVPADGKIAQVKIRDTPSVDESRLQAIAAVEWVYNNVKYDPYPGLMKGPRATEGTRSGNDWDQAALLVQKLRGANISDARFVAGRITAAAQDVRRWLGVRTDEAAKEILLYAGLNPTGPSSSDGLFTFDHAWVRATIPDYGERDFDPSWKFRDFHDGITTGVDGKPLTFDLEGYLSPLPAGSAVGDPENPDAFVRRETPLEFYQGQVAAQLAAQQPGSSLADVAYDGPILQKRFADLSAANVYPYSVEANLQIYTEVPDEQTHRVRVRMYADMTADERRTQEFKVGGGPYRHVMIQLNGQNFLHMAEVDLIDTTGKKWKFDDGVVATQSSTFDANGNMIADDGGAVGAAKAIDGNYDDDASDNSVSHTGNDSHAWWQATLPQDVQLDKIVIHNRSDGGNVGIESRLNDYYVFLSSDAFSANIVDNLTAQNVTSYYVNGRRLIDQTLIVPEAGTKAINVKWDNYSPHLFVGGEILDESTYGQSGDDIGVAGSDAPVHLTLEHLDPGEPAFVSEAVKLNSYQRSPKQPLAVGLGAKQVWDGLLFEMQAELNRQAASAQNDGDAEEYQDNLLGLAGHKYFQELSEGWKTIGGLYQQVFVQPSVNSGVMTGDANVKVPGNSDFRWDLQNPIFNGTLGTDNPNIIYKYVPVDYVPIDVSDAAAQQRLEDITVDRANLQAAQGSALEHLFLEELLNVPSISSIKALQWDNAQEGVAESRSLPSRGFNRKFDPRDYGTWNAAGDGLIFGDNTRKSDLALEIRKSFRPSNYSDESDFNDYGFAYTNESGSWKLSAPPNPLAYIDDGYEKYVRVKTVYDARKKVWDAVLAGRTVLAPSDWVVAGSWQGTAWLEQEWTYQQFHISDLKSFRALIMQKGSTEAHGGSLWYSQPQQNLTPVQAVYPTATPALLADITGDPVNTLTGNLYHDEQDFTIPNVGLPLAFGRHYDSLPNEKVKARREQSPLGSGWLHTYSDFLSFEDDDEGNDIVAWNLSDGNRREFTANGTGGYDNPGGVYGTLTHEGSEFVYTELDGRSWRFADGGDGRLKRIGDRYGNHLDLSYDAGGRLTQVADGNASSRKITFTYFGAGEGPGSNYIKSVGDFTGRSWQFKYVGAGGVPADESAGATFYLADVLGPGTGDPDTDALHHGYTYYWGGRLDALMKEMVSYNEPTDDGYATHTFDYYPNKRVFRVTDSEGNAEHFSYNQYYHSTTYTDPRGDSTIHRFNADGLTRKTVHADGTFDTYGWDDFQMESHTDPLGFTETFQHDAKGNVTQQTAADGKVVLYEYDPIVNGGFNGVTKVTAPGNRVTRNFYDPQGNLTQTLDAAGNPTTMTYDGEGLLQSVTRPRGHQTDAGGQYVIGPNGRVPTKGDGSFTTTYSDFNGAGQAQTVTTDLPSTTRFEYDGRGNLKKQTDPTGVVTNYDYNARDELIRSSMVDPDGTTPSGLIETVTRYIDGKPISVTDPRGNETTHEYDTLDRLVHTVYPVVAGVGRAEERREYDEAGNLVSSTDPLGRETRFVYDDRNRLIQTVHPDGALELARYDAVGRPTMAASHRSLGDGESKPGPYDTYPFARTYTGYDKVGRPLYTTDPANQVTASTYDPATGDLSQAVFQYKGDLPANSRVTTYEYDALGRVIYARSPENIVSTMSYDGDGNVVEAVAYDTTRLLAEGGSVPASFAEAAGLQPKYKRITTTQYDALDRPYRVQLPDNGDGRYERTTQYDAAGRVTAQVDEENRTSRKEYDAIGRLRREIMPDPDAGGPQASPVVSYAYDANGNLTEQRDPLGRATHFLYDELNRQTQAINPTGDVSYVHTAPLAPQTNQDWQIVGAGQFNTGADDNVDLFWQNVDGTLDVWLMDELGNVTGDQVLQTPNLSVWSLATTGDFNNDGRADVLWRDGGGNNVVWTYNLDGTVASGFNLLTVSDPNWHPFAAADFSGDGKTDLAWRNFATGDNVVWRLDGASYLGGFNLPALDPASGWNAVGGGDFDGDGYADWLWQKVSTGEVDVWRVGKDLAGNYVRVGRNQLPDRGGDWRVGGVGDFNKDGLADIAWRNGVTGINNLWLGNPNQSGSDLYASTSTQYDLAGQAVATVDELGRLTTHEYDSRGRMVKEVRPEVEVAAADTTDQVAAPQAVAPTSELTYDLAGNLNASTDPTGVTGTHHYDALGREVRSGTLLGEVDQAADVVPSGNSVAITLPGHGSRPAIWSRSSTRRPFRRVRWSGRSPSRRPRCWTRTASCTWARSATWCRRPPPMPPCWVYTSLAGSEYAYNQSVASIDGRGYRTEYENDLAGRTTGVFSRTLPDYLGGGGREKVAATAYDSLGNVKEETAVVDPITGEGITTSYAYDNLNRKVVASSPDPDGTGSKKPQSVRWQYDKVGNVRAMFDGFADQLIRGSVDPETLRLSNAHTTTYAYDALDRLVAEAGPDPDNEGPGSDGPLPVPVTNYEYDVAGNLLLRTDTTTGPSPATNATEYEYDLLDRKVSEAQLQLAG